MTEPAGTSETRYVTTGWVPAPIVALVKASDADGPPTAACAVPVRASGATTATVTAAATAARHPMENGGRLGRRLLSIGALPGWGSMAASSFLSGRGVS